MMGKIKSVIFDLDGTITVPFLNFDQIRREIGLTADGGTILEEMEHMTVEEKQRALGIIDMHEQVAVENSTLNEGARDTLEWLRQRGIHIGVITRNTKANVLAVARKHGLEFDAVIDRNAGPVKPDAFGVFELCRYFGANPQETIVVGDFLHDVQAGRAAGAVSVLLKNHPRADDFMEHADYVIMRIDEIIAIIENLNAQGNGK